jgi:hypothetical protein
MYWRGVRAVSAPTRVCSETMAVWVQSVYSSHHGGNGEYSGFPDHASHLKQVASGGDRPCVLGDARRVAMASTFGSDMGLLLPPARDKWVTTQARAQGPACRTGAYQSPNS